jgi:capsid portal protein
VELRELLIAAAREPGAIGEAAKRAERLFAEHARKEEKLVFPLLAMLPNVAMGKPHAQQGEALDLSRQLEDALPDLMAEHEVIAGALEALVAAARQADRADLGELAARILGHAHLEESVLYPAALVLAKYLRMRAYA